MEKPDIGRIIAIILRGTGFPEYIGEGSTGRLWFSISHPDYEAGMRTLREDAWSLRISALQSSAQWPRPDRIADDIDEAIAGLDSAIAKIEALDSYAMWHARRDTPDEIARDLGDTVDKRAINAIRRLQRALRHGRAVVERSMTARPYNESGKGGRPPRWPARHVALRAAQIFQRRTGSAPTWWNPEPGRRSTPYGEMVQSLFQELEINGSTRDPIEWAMQKLTENN